MNPDYEKQLEASVGRELNALGELHAPPALARRVMSAISQRAAAPWYRRAWQTWPVSLQAASLAILLALFGGICFGVMNLSQAANGSPAAHEASQWFAWLGLVWKTIGVLGNAITVAIRHLGMGFVIGCVLVLAMAYAACFGVGTAYVRFAMGRR